MTDETADEPDDEEVNPADVLYQSMTVPELREFCSENGINRSRGDSKAETVQAAMDQNPDAVYEAVGVEQPAETYEVMCSCGLHEEYEEEDDAVEAAKSHKGQNISHDVKAWAPNGAMAYGER